MPDLTSKLFPQLRTHRLNGLDISADFIHPKYDDQSILNIPASVCDWLGIPGISGGLLHPEIRFLLGDDIRKVILILMDALSLQRLQTWMDRTPIWRALMNDGVLAPLTSVIPSTTSSALTTLWTGASPAAHGIIGYEMWLKEYSLVANMILHAPMTFKGDVGTLEEKTGFSPEEFLPVSTLGSHLRKHGVQAHSFQHLSIAKSGLSRMFMKNVEIHPFSTPASMWVDMRHLLETYANDKMYIWAYWGQVDGLSHYHGPDNERVAAEFAHYTAAFEQFFLNQLSSQARKDTLVILTADHGQVHTPLYSNQILSNHPGLLEHLIISPTCENRLGNLYIRSGREDAVREYFARTWPNGFELITQDQALEAGLFGPGPTHPYLRDRIGDLIAIASEGAYLWWSEGKDFLLGRHGGLWPDEMIVPFLAARL